MTKKNNTSKTTKKDVLYTPAPDPQWIALNQELTAENARLLEQIDELKDAIARAIKNKNELLDRVKNLENQIETNIDLLNEYSTDTFELKTIKSKWWYKIFKNL